MANLPNISPDLIKLYQEELAKHSSSATIKRKSISLNRFFDWAKEEGHVDENPFTVPQNQTIIAPKIKGSRNVKARTWVVVGITTGLLILIFLLTWKLQLPIPFIKYFAQEINTTNTLTTQVITQSPSPIPANSAVVAGWNLYAKLRITDSGGNPVVGAQTVNFKLFNQVSGGDSLYTSPSQTVTTDANGSVLISLDQVPTDLFFQNNTLYLEPEIGASASASGTITRIPISTANTAVNLGGYSPANPTTGAEPETIPVIDSTGSLNIASQSPAVKATQGNLLIEGQAVTIRSAYGSGGNIDINPDANGYAHFLFEGNKGNFLNAQAPNLTTGSLYYGMVPNNATGYYLINLQSGAPKMTTKFSVDAVGNTNLAGNLSTAGTERLTSAGVLQNITGYSQGSGDFTINQNPGDFVSVNKTLTSGGALSDVMTLTLDERGKPATQNSDYSTLVLNRYDGNGGGAALKVNTGNAIFNGQIQLGRYISNPTSIGQGSMVFNTTDNSVYFWNGSSWVAVGTASTVPFSGILSGINTSATMTVGGGATFNIAGGNLQISGTNVTSTANELNYLSGLPITAGGVIYTNGTTLANTGAGSSNDLLISNGSGTPTWGKAVLGTNTTGNYVSTITGTTNQITTSATTGDVTLSIPSDFRAPGTVNATNGLYTGATAGTQRIDASGNLVNIGTTQFNTQTYNWPASQTASGYLENTDGNGTLAWSTTIAATSVPFSGITSGTNISAAMLVGTGASLDTTGSGTINASSLEGSGKTWEAPGTIGLTTPNTGAFTTLTSSGNSTIGTGASTTNTFGAGASSINTIGSTTTPGDLTLHGATTLDNTFTVSGNYLTTLGGNLAVNGPTSADITSTTTTASLFNSTVTTLNIGGSATTALNIGNGNGSYSGINIGSGTGGNTINIAGTGATGADTVNIGTGGTGSDRINIGNTSSSTSVYLTKGSTGNIVLTGYNCSADSNGGKLTTDASGNIVCGNDIGGAGTTVYWSDIINPLGNLALSMAAHQTSFTWNAATGSNNLFTMQDTTGNTGTGYLFNLQTASGSNLKPFHVSAGSTEALMVNAAGNVGIGTTSPTAGKLQVAGGNIIVDSTYGLDTATAGTLALRATQPTGEI